MLAWRFLGGYSGEMAIPDPRQYLTTPTNGGGAGGSTLFTPIAPRGNSLFARVVSTIPGVMHWWRLGTALSTWGAQGAANDPYFPNSAGPTTLWSVGAVSATAGLVTGDPDGAASLDGGWLEGFDFRAMTTGEEVMSAFAIVDFASLVADSAICGEWETNNGWMLYADSDDLKLYMAGSHLDANAALSTGRHTIAGVWGGSQAPVPDYYTRLYVDGAEVANGLVTIASGGLNNNTTRFQIGNYADGGGNALDAVVDEVILFSRMLQPDEITQLDMAASGVLWP